MSTIVQIAIHPDGQTLADVDLDRLTPRARALAEIVTRNPLHTPSPVIIQSTRTMREMGATADDAVFYGDLDQPHRTTWEHWARIHGPIDPHDYLENEARKLPLGYFPVGRYRDDWVPSADAARDDTDLITRPQIVEVLRELGRPISPATLANYKSNPPKGWPEPVKYVGRTPLWSRTAIERYARGGS